jgi:hypothetical protein
MNAQAAPWADEQIHAFIDGALAPDMAARLAADCRTDPALAARVDSQRRLQMLLRERFDAVLEEPVPQRLLDALDAGTGMDNIKPTGAARRPRTAPPVWWAALAASLLLGLMLGWWLAGSGGLPVATVDGNLLARAELDTALSEQLSGGGTGRSRITVLASLRASDGRFCRAFRLAGGADGLACRAVDGWRVEALGSAWPQAPAAGDSYRQASSALSPAVIAAMEQQQGGDVLTPEQEQRARDAGWRDGLL